MSRKKLPPQDSGSGYPDITSGDGTYTAYLPQVASRWYDHVEVDDVVVVDDNDDIMCLFSAGTFALRIFVTDDQGKAEVPKRGNEINSKARVRKSTKLYRDQIFISQSCMQKNLRARQRSPKSVRTFKMVL